MVTLFRTGHDINERVCTAIGHGFAHADICATYGVLRGSGDWAKRMMQRERPVLVADRGYFKPGHFAGYYRLGFYGTQARFEAQVPDSLRWHSLGLGTEPWQPPRDRVLICPPTAPVAQFYGITRSDLAWGDWMAEKILLQHHGRFEMRVRTKDCVRPLDDDLAWAGTVVTFNSGVGWEALRRGIAAISDVNHSTVGSFLRTTIADLGKPMQDVDRRALFSFMANRQFTLAEIENGTARSYLL